MTATLKMTGQLYDEIRRDLERPHPFAAERVGFVFGRVGTGANGNRLILLTRYHAIPDAQYIDDPTVGARIGPQAMTDAMQAVFRGRAAREGIFHIHVHAIRGETGMSRTDQREIPPMIPGFRSVGRDTAHGIVILSLDHGSAWVSLPGEPTLIRCASISMIGAPVHVFKGRRAVMTGERFDRQSFLGADAHDRIARCTVGVVGLGGGGSHLVQQLAHIGFQRYVIYDDDVVEESNLNRLIGAESRDATAETPKLHIAKMMILGLQPMATIRGFASKWQDNPEPLRECQIVFGALDGYGGRRELEIACRRYLMHYIDIGMDVHGDDPPLIGGQVILSSPGAPCMTCMGFLTEERLAAEAARYGNAGSRPQVVWPNGVLASTAVGLAVDLVTGWTRKNLTHAYLVYNGNEAMVVPSKTLMGVERRVCTHFSADGVGDPVVLAL